MGLYERGEPRHSFAIQPGRELCDFAISPTGVLAWVLGDGTLEVMRGDERPCVALPAALGVRFNV